jgi:putative transposase
VHSRDNLLRNNQTSMRKGKGHDFQGLRKHSVSSRSWEGHDFQSCRNRSCFARLQPLSELLKPMRAISPPGTLFCHLDNLAEKEPLTAEPMARLFLGTLYSYRRQGKFQLHAFVLMPEHFHLLLTPEGIPLERAMQLIKGGYSHAARGRLGNTTEIWERGFTDHRIRDTEDFEHHRMYIHRNPVDRKLTLNACEFRYCSAYPGFRLDPWPSAAEAELLSSA